MPNRHVPLARVFLFATLAAFCCSPLLLVGRAGRDDGQAKPAQGADSRMQWWREARFGMFIHWGLYAIPAGEWQGRTSHAEWIRDTARIPVAEYEKFRDQFNPVKFNADEWVRTAKEGGVRYIVITTKHHDGFCLFDSQYTDWDVMSTPFKRDIMKELVAACRRNGIRIGWYHSIMDWHHPDYLPRRGWELANRPTTGTDFDRYVQYLKNQVREILTNYGPIDIMWFDGQWEATWTHERGLDLYQYVRSLQPSIIVNNRVDKGGGEYQMTKTGGFAGDFGTPEQEVPPTGLPGVDWETCMTMNDHWGYNSHDHNWKSVPTLIRMLSDIASKGGNLLLNVGPTAEGVIPAPGVERLQAIGHWLQANGEAIYGTTTSPFPSLPWGRATQKALAGGNTRLYLHVFDWPKDGRLVVEGLFNQSRTAFLLADATRKPLKVAREKTALVISVPVAAPDPTNTVVVLDLPGRPDVSLPPSITAPTSIFIDELALTVASPRDRIELRYTTDGSDPGPSAALARGPIRVKETTTVTARAFRDGKPVSPMAQASFTKVTPKPAKADVKSLLPGVKYEYFEGNYQKVADFTGLTPTKTGTVATFDLKPRGRDERFAMRYSAYLKVPVSGVYQFALASDDGSRLLIDGDVVVDNDGPHGMTEKVGTVALASGAHLIEVDYFNRDGGYDLKVAWIGPDLPRQPITDRDLGMIGTALPTR
jgi:alpha-L-fucosidase